MSSVKYGVEIASHINLDPCHLSTRAFSIRRRYDEEDRSSCHLVSLQNITLTSILTNVKSVMRNGGPSCAPHCGSTERFRRRSLYTVQEEY